MHFLSHDCLTPLLCWFSLPIELKCMPRTIPQRKKHSENIKGWINVFGEEKKCDPLQQNPLIKKNPQKNNFMAYLHVCLSLVQISSVSVLSAHLCVVPDSLLNVFSDWQVLSNCSVSPFSDFLLGCSRLFSVSLWLTGLSASLFLGQCPLFSFLVADSLFFHCPLVDLCLSLGWPVYMDTHTSMANPQLHTCTNS